MSPLEISGRSSAGMPPQGKLELRQFIDRHFNLEELKTLCFDLAIDWERLPGSTKGTKIRALIQDIDRRGRTEDLIDLLRARRPAADWSFLEARTTIETNPYKGLAYFDESDSAIFFGREALAEKLTATLQQNNFLAVIGASGSGKTSVVRAGLVPALRREGKWIIHILTPTNRPLASLATQLTRDSASVMTTMTLMDDLATDDRSLDLYVRRLFRVPPETSASTFRQETQQYLTDLRHQLIKHFTLQDISDVCSSLGVDYDLLPARGKEAIARELLQYLDRRNEIPDLINLVKQKRPKITWQSPPEADDRATFPQEATLNNKGRLLLIVDQFEELFTQCRNKQEQRSFINNLIYASRQSGSLILIIVLRADFYADAVQFDGLRQALAQNQILVNPMSRSELRAAIEGPAQVAGLTLEPELVERILDDVGEEPGALPLLSHALLETWEQREDDLLTHAGYRLSGGIYGAILQTAEAVYQELTLQEQKWARRIFLQLTELGEGTQDAHRRVNRSELIDRAEDSDAVESVLLKLANAHLITVDLENVEIAHEALVREWDRLRYWLEEDRESLKIHRRLSQDAREWTAHNRDTSYLYRGARLEVIKDWVKRSGASLNVLENEFVAASERTERTRFPLSETEWDVGIGFLRKTSFLLAGIILIIIFVITVLNYSNRIIQSLPLIALTLLVIVYFFQQNRAKTLTFFQNWTAARSQLNNYAEKWKSCTPQEQLILLQAPDKAPFTAEDLEMLFSDLGAGSDAGSIQTALVELTQQDLLVSETGKWRLKHPDIVTRHRQKQGAYLMDLISQTRESNPFFQRAQRFLERADFTLKSVPQTPVYLCQAAQKLTPALRQLEDRLPIYLSFFIGTDLNDTQILKIRDWAKETNADADLVILITNCRLTDSAWAQIGTLRMSSFHILPISHVSIDKGLTTQRESQVLAEEIEKRLGPNYDPYDIRAPVAGAFSFFGREPQVTQFLRHLESGYSFGIFGLRKMGKTSMLHTLRDRAHYPVALVNAQTVSSRGLTALYRRSFEYWALWIQANYHKVWDPPQIDRDETPGSFATKIIELLDWLDREVGDPRLGLFLDEVEQIVPAPEEVHGEKLHLYLGLVRALRGLIDEEHALTLVVASLNPSITRINNWGREQNPTYSLFREYNLPPLARRECRQMIRNIGSQVGLFYDDEKVLEAIIDLSGGHPFLARQFCSTLFALRDRKPGQVTMDEIKPAVHHFIYNDKTVHHLDAGIWQDAGNEHLWGGQEQAQENQTILTEIARENGRVPKAKILEQNRALRQELLIGLKNYGILSEPEPDLYIITFGLLREWLRYRKLGLGELA